MLVTQTTIKALDIIFEAFHGMVDKGGEPYVGHLIRVATKVKGETYDQYINKVLSNELAIKVKLADLKDNMDITRLKELNEGDIKRLMKYHKTFLILKNADNQI